MIHVTRFGVYTSHNILLNDNVEFIVHLQSMQSFPSIAPTVSIKRIFLAMTFDPTAKIQISTR